MKVFKRIYEFNTGHGVIKARLIKIKQNEFTGIPMRYNWIPLSGIDRVMLPEGYYLVNSDLPVTLSDIQFKEQCARTGLTQFIWNDGREGQPSSKYSYWDVEPIERRNER